MLAGRLAIVSALTIHLTAAAVQAQTLSPQQAFGRYLQFTWQDQHGLPQNTIESILRTRDGYLWMGTVEGAARFDGVRFTVFDGRNTPELGNGVVRALLEDRDGALWFGTDGGGLIRLREGRFTRYGIDDGLVNEHVMTLLEDRSGALWIGTQGGLSRFQDGSFRTYTLQHGLPGTSVWALVQDRDRRLWIGTSGGLARMDEGRFVTYTVREGLTDNDVRGLHWDRDGRLWIGTTRGLTWYHDGTFSVATAPESLRTARVFAILQDRQGIVWVGAQGDGLYRFAGGGVSHYTKRDGLPGDQVLEIYEDPDGDLWIGTNGAGVMQLRDGRFRVFTSQNGLPDDSVRGIFEDSTGRLWIATEQGLSHRDGDRFVTHSAKEGLPEGIVRAISEDRDGVLWFATRHGLTRYRRGQFDTLTVRDGLSGNNVFVVLGDRAGNVWAGTMGNGLNCFREGRFTVYTTRDGLPSDEVIALHEDREGSLWIGTRSGGVSRFKDGRFTNWSMKDGLGSNHVLAFAEDRSGALWMGTHGGGLHRFKDGRFRAVTSSDGLYDDLAFQILEDDSGNLWMGGNKGIYRASLAELHDVADGRTTSVTSFAYGVADGMLSREVNGGSPAGWKSRDGQLWFATFGGVVVVDPRRQNVAPPLVAIEGVTIDRHDLAVGEPVRIRPGQANLEIRYTGLSWSRPHQVKFRYRLLGLDDTWVDAGTRRTAYYSHLPPGDYAFQVIGDNGEGVWNDVGRRLAVVVMPAYYQTWWFSAIAMAGIAAAVAVAWHYRVRQLHRAQAVQQAFARELIASQEAERKRIATELHDSLGQQLIIIKSLALLSRTDTNGHDARERQIVQIADVASQAIGEVQTIAYNLRPYQLDRIGLTKAVEAIVRTATQSSVMTVSSEVDDIDGVFPKDAEINFYRIVQESLNNVMKHSGATRVSLVIRRGPDRVHLRVEDNGCGFVPGATTREAGRSGFGLVGISERAQLLGGSLTLHSSPNRGATYIVDIALPGENAPNVREDAYPHRG